MNHVSAQEPLSTAAQMDRWTRQLRVLAALAMPLLIAFLISACDPGGGGATTPTTQARVHVTTTPAPNRMVPNPVGKAETTVAKTLPSFVTSASPELQALYQGAIDYPDAYSAIPCYCGCAMYEQAHTSLMSCFITSTATDGSITWTDHSMNCDICTGIAEMTVAGVQAKTPLAQLREAVHAKFKYTNVWTDTPPVQ